MNGKVTHLLLAACAVLGIPALVDAASLTSNAGRDGTTLSSFVVHGTGSTPVPNQTGVEEAKDLAESTGVSYDKALSYSESTVPWDAAIELASTAEPDNYSSAYRSGASDPGGQIVFVHEPTSGTLANLATLPFDTTVYVGAPGSADTIASAVNATYLAAKSAGLQPVSAGADPRTSAITVQVAAPASASELDAGRLAVSKAVDTILRGNPVNVTVVTTSRIARGFASITGGGHDLQSNKVLADGSRYECTSGFATSQNGVNGITTASHCYNYMLWGTTLNVISYVNSASSVSGGDIDLQFNKTINGYSATPRFQATGSSSSDIQSVDSARNAVGGDYINKYGIGYGYSHNCKVSLLNTYIDTDSEDDGKSHHYVGLARVDLGGAGCSAASWGPGDSGGPVWERVNGLNQAAGSVTGGDKVEYAYYTPQTRWGSNLNASVLLDN